MKGWIDQMIRIGFGVRQKQDIVNDYVGKHNIKQIIVLNTNQHDIRYNFSLDVEYVEYNEWEMYRTFYPLIEKIDKDTLVVVDEVYRTTNVQDLKYNCATVFLNQTEHRIIFSTFPFINDKDDFRILMKFEKANKHVDKFDYSILKEEDILVNPKRVKMDIINVPTTNKQKSQYEKRKERLFDNLGNKDPNTIPRNLQLLAGDFKKPLIEDDKLYIARNQRFKRDNVYSYNNYIKSKDYIVIDTHYSRVQFIDFLIDNKITTVKYLATDLSIDRYIIDDFTKWKARLDAFYAKASLYK